jgi:carbon-monoxide dehydrogenase iron sulfur subunit
VKKAVAKPKLPLRVEYQPTPEKLEGWCAGCRLCEVLCSLQNIGICNPKASRIRVISWQPSVDVPVTCRQCKDPLCAEVCPVDAFVETAIEGVLRVEPEQCIGCGACAEACPFGAISIDPSTGLAGKCDLCGGQPLCIEYCPADVLKLLTSESNRQEKMEQWARVVQEQKEKAETVLREIAAGSEQNG